MKRIDQPTEIRADSLDISAQEMEALSSQVTELVTDYFSSVSNLRVFPETVGGEIRTVVGAEIPLDGVPLEKLIDDCKTIIAGSRHNGHPRFFGYVASPSTPAGAFADLIASTLNANVTSWRSGPAATEIERIVVRWLGSLIGYSENAGGLLMSGGSLANLTALLIAQRTKAKPGASRHGLWNATAPMTVYASDQVHLSIPKAADILGLGRDQVRVVPSNSNLRMSLRSLREQIESDLANGLRPFCVVASAGTVNTGAIDPLADIAAIATEYKLWFHVDGAYGAPGALDARKRSLFRGLERADSVSLDPHKWLYVPLDVGCLLLNNDAAARVAFGAQVADYIKVHEQTEEEAFAFWDYGQELSRRFRALKVWLTLRYYGTRRIAEMISKDNSLAEYLADSVEKAEDFELLAPVELSICCFRYVPPELRLKLASAGDVERAQIETSIDQLNAEIMHAVQRGGQAYISNATVRGKFALRACIINFRTTFDDIDQTLGIIREAARVVGKESGG